MKTLALLVIGGAIVFVIIIGQNHEDGISGVWNDLVGQETPGVNKVELDIELDLSTP